LAGGSLVLVKQANLCNIHELPGGESHAGLTFEDMAHQA
jgi:hypothetical protein